MLRASSHAKFVRDCGKFVGCELQPTIVRYVSLLS
jgi:hypothetical protein